MALSVLTPVILKLKVASAFPNLAASELCRREFESVHGTFVEGSLGSLMALSIFAEGSLGSLMALSALTPVVFWFEVVSAFPSLAARELCRREFEFCSWDLM